MIGLTKLATHVLRVIIMYAIESEKHDFAMNYCGGQLVELVYIMLVCSIVIRPNSVATYSNFMCDCLQWSPQEVTR